MLRTKMIHSLLSTIPLLLASSAVVAGESYPARVAEALALFEGAELRFQAPDPEWFESTREALAAETIKVEAELESHGEEYAAAWKKHLRWHLLSSNLGPVSQTDASELAVVRRWLYSNRKGLEYPFFAKLRECIDAHLDAAVTFTQPALESEFLQHVETARVQLTTLAKEPNDANAAKLGHTLGWFEQTGQLTNETAQVRQLLSKANAQILVRKALLERIIDYLSGEVQQTLPVSDRVSVTSSRLLGSDRTANVRGTAETNGEIDFELVANPKLADMQLIYNGDIDSRCQAVIGPVNVAMLTVGTVRAVTPVQISMQGVKLLTTEVMPKVHTHVTGVSARSDFLRRIGGRRAREPNARQQMNSRARVKAASLIQEEMAQRVETAIDEIRAELQQAQDSLDSFRDVLAPIVREGAAPRWEGLESTEASVIANATSRRREQFGALLACPHDALSADVQARFHVSFFNNMAETIMAGKTFTDKYFMNYGRILQAELPPQLMVHARSVRWAIVAAKPRPLVIAIPESNQIHIELRIQRVDVGEDQFTGPTSAKVRYQFVKNDFEEFELQRQGEVEIDCTLPTPSREFLLAKLSAFFAPVLDAGGVALPEGGALGRLRELRPQGAIVARDWLSLGVNVPTEVMQQWLSGVGQGAE